MPRPAPAPPRPAPLGYRPDGLPAHVATDHGLPWPTIAMRSVAALVAGIAVAPDVPPTPLAQCRLMSWQRLATLRLPRPCWRAIIAALADPRMPRDASPADPRGAAPRSVAARARALRRGCLPSPRIYPPRPGTLVSRWLRVSGWPAGADARDLACWARSPAGRSVLGDPVTLADMLLRPGAGLSRARAASAAGELRSRAAAEARAEGGGS